MSLVQIVDTETTGMEPGRDQVIELAQITVRLVQPDVIDVEYDTVSRFRPSVPIAWGAMATHHIHTSDLVDQPPLPPSFENHFFGVDYIIGHNIDFDWKMLGKPPVKRICTLAIARTVWQALDSHTLGALMYYLFGVAARDRVKGAHAALEDCYMVYDILEALRQAGYWTTWEDLYELSEKCRLPHTMTFGKHKGQPVHSVDMGYRQWYFKQPDADPYLLKAWGYHVDIE